MLLPISAWSSRNDTASRRRAKLGGRLYELEDDELDELLLELLELLEDDELDELLLELELLENDEDELCELELELLLWLDEDDDECDELLEELKIVPAGSTIGSTVMASESRPAETIWLLRLLSVRSFAAADSADV
jgi:hypothetical protein